MSIRLIAAFILLLGSPASWGAIAHVADDTCAQNTSATSLGILLSTNPTAGNTLIIGVRLGAAGRTITVSDDKSNTWVQDLLLDATAVGAGEQSVYRASNVASGATTLTVAISGAAASVRFCPAEFSGLTNSSPLDVTKTATQSTVTAITTGATSTRTVANELLFGVTGNDNSGSGNVLTAGTGFTIGSLVSCSNGNCLGVEWQIVSVTGTDACTFTINHTVSTGALCATYKISSGATTVPGQFPRVL